MPLRTFLIIVGLSVLVCGGVLVAGHVNQNMCSASFVRCSTPRTP